MAKDDKKKKDAPKKDVKKDKVPKVTPSKEKGQNNVKSKARNMLLKHPQVTQNARGLFRNENGKTIVEEIVHRGDAKVPESITPRNQGDLTDDDLRSLAVHASTLVDKNIAKYDPIVASEDALNMSIRTKDGGKYDGKVNANTFQLLLDNMKGLKKAADDSKNILEQAEEVLPQEEEKPKEEEAPSALDRGKEKTKAMIEKLEEGKKERREQKAEKAKKQEETAQPIEETPKEETMDKKILKQEKEAMLKKLAALDELIGEETVEAAEGEDDAKVEDMNNPAEPDKEDAEGESKNPITASLDKIAGELEKQNDEECFKMAYQLDQISDILEGRKEAATFESDPDEKFMKTFFKGGLHEGDSDEKYMKEFNTDLTHEVNAVKDKKNGKEASEKLPYQKVD